MGNLTTPRGRENRLVLTNALGTSDLGQGFLDLREIANALTDQLLLKSSLMGESRFCLRDDERRGGIAGGRGADRDFLVQRRLQHENKAFPLKHLAPANAAKNSAFLTIPLREQGVGGPLAYPMARGMVEFRLHWLGLVLGGKAGN